MNNFTQKELTQEQAIKIFLRDYLNNPKNGQTINHISTIKTSQKK